MCKILSESCISKNEKGKVHTHTWFGSGMYVRKVSIVSGDMLEGLRKRLFDLTRGELPTSLRKWNAISEKIPQNKTFRLFADIDFKPSVIKNAYDIQQFVNDMKALCRLYYRIQRTRNFPLPAHNPLSWKQSRHRQKYWLGRCPQRRAR